MNNHRKLIRWAREYSEHVLFLIDREIDERLTDALGVTKKRENCSISTGVAMKALLGAHAVARSEENPVYRAVARSVGQTVASAHMADYSLGGAFYALMGNRFATWHTHREMPASAFRLTNRKGLLSGTHTPEPSASLHRDADAIAYEWCKIIYACIGFKTFFITFRI